MECKLIQKLVYPYRCGLMLPLKVMRVSLGKSPLNARYSHHREKEEKEMNERKGKIRKLVYTYKVGDTWNPTDALTTVAGRRIFYIFPFIGLRSDEKATKCMKGAYEYEPHRNRCLWVEKHVSRVFHVAAATAAVKCKIKLSVDLSFETKRNEEDILIGVAFRYVTSVECPDGNRLCVVTVPAGSSPK